MIISYRKTRMDKDYKYAWFNRSCQHCTHSGVITHPLGKGVGNYAE